MRTGGFLLLLAACLGLFGHAANCHAEIVQYFDQHGVLLPRDYQPPALSGSRPAALAEGAEFRKDVVYHFYPVFGKTFTEMVRSIEENGPSVPGERTRQPSHLEWKIGFSYVVSYDYEQSVEDASVTVDLELSDVTFRNVFVVTLPSAVNDSGLTPIERSLFRNYVTRILAREFEKIRIIEDSTVREEIRGRLSSVIGFRFFPEPGQELEQVVERFVRETTSRIGSDFAAALRERLARAGSSAPSHAP